MNAYSLQLETFALRIIYEALSEFKNTALLFSGGKDSAVLAHLIAKAVNPEKISVNFLLIDTGHNFIETLEFIKKIENKYNISVHVGSVSEALRQGLVTDVKGLLSSRNKLQSVVLNNEIPEREVVKQALQFQPELFKSLYVDLAQREKDDKVLNEALLKIETYMEENINILFKYLFQLMLEFDSIVGVSEIHKRRDTPDNT